MLVHDRFVFLHLQRTGGTFLASVLSDELPAGSLRLTPEGDRHLGWADIPAAAADRPVLLYVRNPWDWYVSRYHLLLNRRPDKGALRAALADSGDDFGAGLRLALSGAQGNGGSSDFYTNHFLRVAGAGLDSDRLTIGRFESLFDDLERFLSEAGVELPEGAMARIRSSPPVNASANRRHYRDYYDPELRDLVGESCRTMIDRFGYRF